MLGCNQDIMTVTIKHREELKGIPSASGIVVVNNDWYVIGDNAPLLYRLDQNFAVVETRLLIEGNTDSIIPKISKPDFEAMTTIDDGDTNALLIFGSGSKTPERDKLVMISLKKDGLIKTFDLKAVYDAIRNSGTIAIETLNIEAATTIDDRLFLFNRETNMVLEYSLKDLMNFLETDGALPTFQMYQLQLPKLEGLQAKLSGATTIPNTNHLLITASVEDSPNTYDDGNVVGSYVGMISIDQIKDGYRPKCVLLMEHEQALKVKVESVEIVKVINDQHYQLALVTDSDGGVSELILAELSW